MSRIYRALVVEAAAITNLVSKAWFLKNRTTKVISIPEILITTILFGSSTETHIIINQSVKTSLVISLSRILVSSVLARTHVIGKDS